MITIKEYNSNFEVFVYDDNGDFKRRILEGFDGYEDFTTEENLDGFFEMNGLSRDDFTAEELLDLKITIGHHSKGDQELSTRNYYIMDDATSASAAIFGERLPDGTTKEEAISDAYTEWMHLTRREQRERDSFELIYAGTDDEGCIDWNTADTIMSFKYDNRDYAGEALRIICNGQYEIAVQYMDDDLREELHVALSPCSEYEFLRAYMEAHYEKYMENFPSDQW